VENLASAYKSQRTSKSDLSNYNGVTC
jgi:hypothetical protein